MVARLVTRAAVAAAVLVAIATMAAASAPPDLVARPKRPFEGDGTSRVRTESARFPRYATGADDVRVRLDRPPRRIVSTDAQADEFLASIVPPERLAGLSATAFEPRASNVLGLVNARGLVVAANAEAILSATPDLVVSAMSTPAEQVGLLRHTGVPVYRLFTMLDTLEAIEAHIRLFGYLTGEDTRAALEAGRFRDAITRAAAMRPANAPAPRVLGIGGAYSYGQRTLFTDILRRLGAENVAATHGLIGYDRVGPEQIAHWDPDWIVAGAPPGREQAMREQLLRQPAIAATRAAARGQIVVLDNRVFLPLSPYTARLVEQLAGTLFGAR